MTLKEKIKKRIPKGWGFTDEDVELMDEIYSSLQVKIKPRSINFKQMKNGSNSI